MSHLESMTGCGGRRFPRWLVGGLIGLTLSGAAYADLGDDEEAQLEDLKAMSFEELLDIKVTSVSKRAEKRMSAAAAITVLTEDDLRRSGHRSIPEALRMVPGLQVARIDASNWAISARGFNDQFANKLLVLIDGRSVYTPLFGGVYWDVQDLVLADVERIEVIRGPGGTLWGANAVNGVINIITKSAKDTQGLHLLGGGGSIDRGFIEARYGGSTEDLAYRVYGKGTRTAALEATQRGGNAQDDWWVGRVGFRTDWSRSPDSEITFQGDYYNGEVTSRFAGTAIDEGVVEGGNLLARWKQNIDEGRSLTLQTYYDRSERNSGGLAEERDTIDVEAQYDHDLTDRVHLTVGTNYRLHIDQLDASTPGVFFQPAESRNHLFTAFIQGQTSLFDDTLVLTAGSKFEHNDFSGFEFQPSIRGAWTPSDSFTLWAALSRAVRTPSQANDGLTLIFPVGPGTFASRTGTERFRPEEVLSWEVGVRGSPLDRLQIDLTAFVSDYENVRSNESQPPAFVPNPPPGFTLLPSIQGNQRTALVWGIEAEVAWQVRDDLRIRLTYACLDLEIDRDAGSTDPDGELVENQNSQHQVGLHARWDLPYDFEIDSSVYYVDDLPAETTASGRGVDSYWRADLRIAHQFDEHVELSLVGQNLLDRRHPEFGNGTIAAAYIPRSVYGSIRIEY